MGVPMPLPRKSRRRHVSPMREEFIHKIRRMPVAIATVGERRIDAVRRPTAAHQDRRALVRNSRSFCWMDRPRRVDTESEQLVMDALGA